MIRTFLLRNLLTGTLLSCIVSITIKVDAQSVEEAKLLIRNQNYKQARQVMSQLLEKSPRNAEYNYYMGLSFLESSETQEDETVKAKELEEAKSYFTKGIEKSSKNPYNFAGIGEYYVLTKNTAEANANLEKAAQLGTNDGELLTLVAEARIMSKSQADQDIANILLKRAETLDAKNPDIYLAAGENYFQQNIEEVPLIKYDRALALNPNLIRAHYLKGKYFVRYKKYNEGAKEFLKAMEMDANFAPAYADLGDLYFRAQRYTEGKEYYRKYVELREKSEGGRDVSARYRYVLFLFLSKDYANAVDEINNVLKDTTSNVMYRLLAYSNYELGKLPEAQQAMDTYLARIKPQYIIAKDYEYKGKIAIKQGKLDEGAGDVLRSVQMDPTRTDLYQEVVKAYVAAKQYDKAIDIQKRAVAADTKSIAAYYALGKLYDIAKKYKESDSAYKKVVELRPDFITGYLELARVNNKLDDGLKEGLAKPYYEKILELGSKDPEKNKPVITEANLYLANYYDIHNNSAEAMNYYTKFLSLTPDEKSYKNSLIDANNFLAYYYLTKANYNPGKAINYIQESLRIDPTNARAKELSASAKGSSH